MSVANPPYLRSDLLRLCEYATHACLSAHPVRIWCVVPATCREVPDLQHRIREASGHVLAIWPSHSFPFVPLDCWVGQQVYQSTQGHTAPMPILLVVFQNTAAHDRFPISVSHLRLLQTWTRYALGEKGKHRQWDPFRTVGLGTWTTADCTTWWESACVAQPLLDIFLPKLQWWTKVCPPPFDKISPWVGSWGAAPPNMQDWLRYIGLSHYQSDRFIGLIERMGIETQTNMWLKRGQKLATEGMTDPPSTQSSAIAADLPTQTNQTLNPFPVLPTINLLGSRKRKLDAVTTGTTPTLARQMGQDAWWPTHGIPFMTLVAETQRWKHLFLWLRAPDQGPCSKCGQHPAYDRHAQLLCKTCRWALTHQPETQCFSLHCAICGTDRTNTWWSLALLTLVCEYCKTLSPVGPPQDAKQICPFPNCKNKPSKVNISIDLSGFCDLHIKRQPNVRQFTMLRLKRLLQELNCQSRLPETSYQRQNITKLWPIADLQANGGVSDMNNPHQPWQLNSILPHLAPLTSTPASSQWCECPFTHLYTYRCV